MSTFRTFIRRIGTGGSDMGKSQRSTRSAVLGCALPAMLAPTLAVAQSANPGAAPLEEITVTGSRYHRNVSETGSKLPMEVVDTPAAVNFVTRELIEDTGAITLEDVAARVSALFGVGIAEFQRQLRMQKAAELVARTDRPLACIARDVGYEHASSFTLAFKRQYHVSPKEMRGARRVGPLGRGGAIRGALGTLVSGTMGASPA